MSKELAAALDDHTGTPDDLRERVEEARNRLATADVDWERRTETRRAHATPPLRNFYWINERGDGRLLLRRQTDSSSIDSSVTESSP
jgi:hypothetical protein